MEFSAAKCYDLRITHARSLHQQTYTLNNTNLQDTNSHIYLGVDISHDLTWNSHINRIVAKAYQTQKSVFMHITNQRNVYNLDTSSAGLCSSVCDPHTKKTKQNKLKQNKTKKKKKTSINFNPFRTHLQYFFPPVLTALVLPPYIFFISQFHA